MNYELCIESCKLLANHHNVPFMIVDKELKNLAQDKARDNEHFGPKTHTAIARHFFNLIDNMKNVKAFKNNIYVTCRRDLIAQMVRAHGC